MSFTKLFRRPERAAADDRHGERRRRVVPRRLEDRTALHQEHEDEQLRQAVRAEMGESARKIAEAPA